MKNQAPEESELIPTRKSLLSRLKDWNDNESWKIFFDTYWRLIYGTALRSGLGSKEAEDIVQETVVSVMKAIPNFHYDPAKGSFKGWLSAITDRRITDYLRKTTAERHAIDSFHPLTREDDEGNCWEQLAEEGKSDFESIWDQEWEINFKQVVLERVKRKVDQKHFQIFDLHVIREWDAADVARTLNVPRAFVYLTKHRIQKVLREEEKYLLKNPMGCNL